MDKSQWRGLGALAAVAGLFLLAGLVFYTATESVHERLPKVPTTPAFPGTYEHALEISRRHEAQREAEDRQSAAAARRAAEQQQPATQRELHEAQPVPGDEFSQPRP